MVNATIFYSIKLNRSIRLVYGILRHMKGIRQASCHRDTNDTHKSISLCHVQSRFG